MAGATNEGSVRRTQVHEPHAFGELVEHLAGELHREAGLANASGPGEGDERRGGEDLLRLGYLPLAPHEGGELPRKVVRSRVDGPQGRKVSFEAGSRDLVELLRCGEVLELVLAEVHQAHLVGELAAREVSGRLAQQDLTAMSGSADPRGTVHVDAHVARLAARGLPGMHPHPHAKGGGPFLAASARWPSIAASTASRARGNA